MRKPIIGLASRGDRELERLRRAALSAYRLLAGDYAEELHGGELDLRNIEALQPVMLTVPSHYGRIWTRLDT